jgi:hypothetical protein
MEAVGFPTTANTARRRAHANGIHNYRAVKKPRLSDDNREKRRQYGELMDSMTEQEREEIIWTDEKEFKSYHAGPVRH